MQSVTRILGLSLLFIVSWGLAPQFVHADVEATTIKQIDLSARPLDIATSADGQLLFVLIPGEILVYSIYEDKVNRIPVDKAFDRLTYSARTNALVLASSSAKSIEIIQVELIHDIAVSGLPFKGPADAPVTIAVFGDYQ